MYKREKIKEESRKLRLHALVLACSIRFNIFLDYINGILLTFQVSQKQVLKVFSFNNTMTHSEFRIDALLMFILKVHVFVRYLLVMTSIYFLSNFATHLNIKIKLCAFFLIFLLLISTFHVRENHVWRELMNF